MRASGTPSSPSAARPSARAGVVVERQHGVGPAARSRRSPDVACRWPAGPCGGRRPRTRSRTRRRPRARWRGRCGRGGTRPAGSRAPRRVAAQPAAARCRSPESRRRDEHERAREEQRPRAEEGGRRAERPEARPRPGAAARRRIGEPDRPGRAARGPRGGPHSCGAPASSAPRRAPAQPAQGARRRRGAPRPDARRAAPSTSCDAARRASVSARVPTAPDPQRAQAEHHQPRVGDGAGHAQRALRGRPARERLRRGTAAAGAPR